MTIKGHNLEQKLITVIYYNFYCIIIWTNLIKQHLPYFVNLEP